MTAKKILIIDDEKELIDTIEPYLSARGYAVTSAVNSREGLKKIREKPDMVLLDIMMPGLDGFEVLRRTRDNPETKDLGVIMLTAKSESSSIFKAQDLGATDYIIKPFRLGELMGVIKKYI